VVLFLGLLFLNPKNRRDRNSKIYFVVVFRMPLNKCFWRETLCYFKRHVIYLDTTSRHSSFSLSVCLVYNLICYQKIILLNYKHTDNTFFLGGLHFLCASYFLSAIICHPLTVGTLTKETRAPQSLAHSVDMGRQSSIRFAQETRPISLTTHTRALQCGFKRFIFKYKFINLLKTHPEEGRRLSAPAHSDGQGLSVGLLRRSLGSRSSTGTTFPSFW